MEAGTTSPKQNANNPNVMANYSQKVIDQLLVEPEAKRENFRLYLENAHVMDVLSSFFVGLYDEGDKEKPEKILEYFLQNLSIGIPLKSKVDSLLVEVEGLRSRFADLEFENQRMREHLQIYEPTIPQEELGEVEDDGVEEAAEVN